MLVLFQGKNGSHHCGRLFRKILKMHLQIEAIFSNIWGGGWKQETIKRTTDQHGHGGQCRLWGFTRNKINGSKSTLINKSRKVTGYFFTTMTGLQWQWIWILEHWQSSFIRYSLFLSSSPLTCSISIQFIVNSSAILQSIWLNCAKLPPNGLQQLSVAQWRMEGEEEMYHVHYH